MNGIIGMSELLYNTELNERQQKYINTIVSSSDMLLSIINDVLDFSKIEAGELKLEQIPVSLNNICAEVVQLLSERARGKNIELAVRSTFRPNVLMLADPMRLRQILLNLVSNAIKFTDGGYVRINIEEKLIYGDNLCFRAEVTDTGIGIPEDKLDMIFDKFTQADSSTTRQYGGTGLGLAICKHLIEKMGGKIGVISELRGGSTFWFELTLPICSEQLVQDAPDYSHLKGKKVLVVDDKEVNRQIITEYLTGVDMICHQASTGEDALNELLSEEKSGKPYDIALVDYLMPAMNGEMLGRAICANTAINSTKLILITALDNIKNLDFIRDAGFSAELIKPIYPSQLLRILNDTLEEKHKPAQKKEPAQKKSEELNKFNIRILSVEDIPENRMVISEMFEHFGCSIIHAVNGKQAMNILANDNFDLILMDINMPEMDGYAATKEIRKQKHGKDMKIIALTANALHGDKEKCLAAGMDDYISKPLKMRDINDKLYKYFG